ncbi:MAG: hypothetical protein AAF236_05350, partial [Verrucomicrobiota bacterium]
MSFAGGLVAALGIWLALQAVGCFCSFATSWPLWVIALLGGVAVEVLVSLYRFERDLVNRSRGRWLLGLRLAALAVLLLILAQPVRSFFQTREIEREIAIVIDESESMQLSDQRLTPTEILERGELFELEVVADRPRLSAIQQILRELDALTQTELEALATAPTLADGFANRASQLPVYLDQVEATTAQAIGQIEETLSLRLPTNPKNRLNDAKRRLGDPVTRSLSVARNSLEEENADAFAEQLEGIQGELRPILDAFPRAIAEADETFYNYLTDAEKEELNAAAGRPRIEIAREILNHSTGYDETP